MRENVPHVLREAAETAVSYVRSRTDRLGLPANWLEKRDLHVHVRVVTPKKLTREQRHLLEQLAATLREDNRPAERSSGFFDKVKDIFG